MPYAAPKPCRHRGCPKVTTHKRGYCEQHRKHSWDQGANGQKRESAYRRGYGRDWREIREAVLRDEPLCRPCNAEGRLVYATELDHIDGDTKNNARENLQPICIQCHARKTARDKIGQKAK